MDDINEKNYRSLELQCLEITSLSTEEIQGMIDPATLQGIKASDPHPYFQVYSIAHEGVSEPRIIGEESVPITWTRRAIQSIKNAIKKGIKFFLGHNEDNSTEGRRSLGEIVGNGEKIINNKLHSLVVGYFPPGTRDEVKKYDICSQESTWDFIESAGKIFADKIEELTGIALGNSGIDKPAFIGARRLGTLQAFNESDKSDYSDKNIKNDRRYQMTFEDVKKAVKDLNIFAWQLFTIEEIKNDKEYGRFITENENLSKTLKDKETEISTVKSEYEKKVNELTKDKLATTAKTRLADLISKNEIVLTDNQKKFVTDNLSIDKLEDLSDDGLKNYVNGQIDIYQKVASVISPESVIKTKSGDGVKSGGSDIDVTKKQNNELLKDDYIPA